MTENNKHALLQSATMIYCMYIFTGTDDPSFEAAVREAKTILGIIEDTIKL